MKPPPGCVILDRDGVEKLAGKFARQNTMPLSADASGYCFQQVSGEKDGLLVFAAVWLTILFFVVRSFLNNPDNHDSLVVPVLLLAFFLVGMGMVATWSRSRFRKVWLLLTPTAIFRWESLGPLGRRHVFPVADLAGFKCRRDKTDPKEAREPPPETLFVVRKDAREHPLLDAFRGSEMVEWLGEILHRKYALPISGALGLFADEPAPDNPHPAAEAIIIDADAVAANNAPDEAENILPIEYPPPSTAWHTVFPAASASFTDILFQHGLARDSGDQDSFAVKTAYPSPFYLVFCLVGGGVGLGFGHRLLRDWPQASHNVGFPGLGMDALGVVIGGFFVLVGLHAFLARTTFIFLPDRLKNRPAFSVLAATMNICAAKYAARAA